MKKLIVFFIMLVTLFSLSSCVTSNGGKTYVSGDFKYKINSNSGEIMLIGFSDEGKTKETIVLPTMIGKRKVTTIGYLVNYLIDDGDGVWKANFSDGIFKKIYIHSFIKKAEHISIGKGLFASGDKNGFEVFYGKYLNNTELMLSSQLYDVSKCYVSSCEDIQSNFGFEEYNNANVVYYLNDDTNDTFFVDDCDGTKVNVIPPDPYRDGYEFMGWYKEKETINKFDFEKDIIPSKQYDSSNNYIFNETSIYAKWESNAK